MKRVRSAVLIPVLVAVLLAGPGCTRVPTRQATHRPDSATAPGQELVTIRVITGLGGLTEAQVSAFYAAYPNYRIQKVQPPPGADLQTFIELQVAEGKVDVIPTYNLPQLVAKDLLLPLDPYIQSGRLDLTPYGDLVEQMRWDGRLYDLPGSISPEVVVYNKALFQAAGVPLPQPGWTWDQFRAAAAALTRGEGEGRVWGFAAPVPERLVGVWLQGTTGSGLEQATAEDVLAALQFLATMVHTDRSMPPVPERDWRGNLNITRGNEFETGRAAMTLNSLSALEFLGQSLSFDWDVVPLPVSPRRESIGTVYPRGLGVAATSPNPEAAWELIAFLAGPEGAAAAAGAGLLPLYRTPEVKAAWLNRQPPPPPGTAALFDLRWTMLPRQAGSAQSRWEALYQAANRVLSGQSLPEAAAAAYMQEVGSP